MTDDLADYYGAPAGSGEADAAGFKRTDTGTAAGLLGHGGVLTTHALPTSSSPIHRGKLVRERLLCQEMPPPPPALDTSPPPVDPTLSTRERYTQHSADPTCAGCHTASTRSASASNTTTPSAASAPWTAPTPSTRPARSS
jgi:hypothetical protein